MASLIEILHCDGPAPDQAAQMALYGWLVGDWEMDAVMHIGGRGSHKGRGEIHAGWVLEGRAIQDVWILPSVFYGTTIRIYDQRIQAWQILWTDSMRFSHMRQIGRARGADIVQEGKAEAGGDLRWTFTDISPRSFRWLGEYSRDRSETWHTQAEFSARRVSP